MTDWFKELNHEADRRLKVRTETLDVIRSNGFVVLDIATAKLLQLEVKSGAFCSPTPEQLQRIESEITLTQSLMRGK